MFDQKGGWMPSSHYFSIVRSKLWLEAFQPLFGVSFVIYFFTIEIGVLYFSIADIHHAQHH
jgi:hypothetical protein